MNTIVNRGATVNPMAGGQGAEGAQGTGEPKGAKGAKGAGNAGYQGETPPAGSNGSSVVVLGNDNPPGDPDAAAARAAGALEVLGDENASIEDKFKALMTLVSDPNMLSRLMIEFANMSRQNALDGRLAAREAARGDLEAAAAETREAAQKQLTGAIVSMVIAVVVAVVSVVAFVSAVGGAAKSFNQSKEVGQAQKIAKTAEMSGSRAAPKLGEQARTMGAAAEKTANNVQAMNNLMQTGNSFLRAMGEGTGQIFQSQATVDQAEGQEKQAKATEEQSNADIAKKVVEDLEELVKAALQFLKAMQAAETDLMANMTRV